MEGQQSGSSPSPRMDLVDCPCPRAPAISTSLSSGPLVLVQLPGSQPCMCMFVPTRVSFVLSLTF